MFKTSFLMGDKETLRKLGMAVGLLDHDTGCRVDTEPAMKAAGVDGCLPRLSDPRTRLTTMAPIAPLRRGASPSASGNGRCF